MSNIALVLRNEIVRISRRELRKETAVFQRSSAQYRRDIAALKRTIASLQRALKQQHHDSAPTVDEVSSEGANMRFVAKGFRSLRRRLGLSAGQLGKLLKVSEQSIFNWETKKRRREVLTCLRLRAPAQVRKARRCKPAARQVDSALTSISNPGVTF
jgi:DNA-binding XRE family transcriptional regulator